MSTILKIFPSRHSFKWLWVTLIYMIIICCSFFIGSILLLGRNLNGGSLVSITAVAFIISFIISLTGFLNAKFIFASSSIGLILAIIALFVILSRKATGWEDLIGPLVFLEITALGFVIGVVLEVAIRIIAKPAKNKARE